MAYNPNPNQRPAGPGRGPGFGGPGMRTPAPSEALKQFKDRLSAKASFGDDNIMALAEDLARDFAQGFGRKEKKESGKTQVRKVYGEVRALQEKAKAGFETVRPELRLIQAHVAYAVGRDTLTPEFKDFVDAAVKRLLEAGRPEELDRFVKFFEALYAHFYFQTSKHGQKEG
jgi:CRISPR type III-A-associated protein Csm2